jgi:heme/copper-type cytochrome/quinol oxidase subunit 3
VCTVRHANAVRATPLAQQSMVGLLGNIVAAVVQMALVVNAYSRLRAMQYLERMPSDFEIVDRIKFTLYSIVSLLSASHTCISGCRKLASHHNSSRDSAAAAATVAITALL